MKGRKVSSILAMEATTKVLTAQTPKFAYCSPPKYHHYPFSVNTITPYTKILKIFLHRHQNTNNILVYA
jgi:hypothetical protein